MFVWPLILLLFLFFDVLEQLSVIVRDEPVTAIKDDFKLSSKVFLGNSSTRVIFEIAVWMREIAHHADDFGEVPDARLPPVPIVGQLQAGGKPSCGLGDGDQVDQVPFEQRLR